jgi:hypothetical protein
VARSLGVPSVIGVSADELGRSGCLVAVDGSDGTVASFDAAADRRGRRPA